MLIDSPQSMQNLWKEISKNYSHILLYWDLWAWKTLFTKGFAEWLWIDPKKIQSPTYTYLNIYENKLLHLDFYRLSNYSELVEKGIEEQIFSYDYVVIERPKFEPDLGLDKRKKIIINKVWENQRQIIF